MTITLTALSQGYITTPPPNSTGIVYGTTKTANYTAVSNDGVFTNTTGGAFTVTLPAIPSNGMQVIITDAAGTWGTNNLTVGRNSNNIADLAEDFVLDISGASVQFVYNSTATATWEVFAQIGGNGGTAVTLTGTQTLTNKTLTAPTIASANLTTALTLAGAAGSNGQVLTSAGSGLPSWATPSAGALTLLSTVTASSSATVDIETTFDATYRSYIIKGSDIKNSVNGMDLYIRFKLAGAYVTTSTYNYHRQQITSSSALYAAQVQNLTTGIATLYDTSTDADDSSSITVEIDSPTSTTLQKLVKGYHASVADNGDANGGFFTGTNGTAGALTGIRFYPINGTILSGTFKLYGIT